MTIRLSDSFENSDELENTLVLGTQDIYSLEDLLPILSEGIKKGKMNFLINGVDAKLEEVFKRANSYISRMYRRMLLPDVNRIEISSELEEYIALQNKTLQISLNSQTLEDEEDFLELLNIEIKNLKLVKEFLRVDIEAVEELASEWDKAILLPHPEEEKTYYLARLHPKCDQDQAYFLICPFDPRN